MAPFLFLHHYMDATEKSIQNSEKTRFVWTFTDSSFPDMMPELRRRFMVDW